jgi:tetratricopeptide (TPR) repeat protein
MVGDTLAKLGDTTNALENHRKALLIREALAAADPMDLWKRWDLIESYAKTAKALALDGDAVAALDACRKTQTLLADTTDDPTNAFLRNYRAYASSDVAEALTIIAASNRTALAKRREQWTTAESLYRQSAETAKDVSPGS